MGEPFDLEHHLNQQEYLEDQLDSALQNQDITAQHERLVEILGYCADVLLPDDLSLLCHACGISYADVFGGDEE